MLALLTRFARPSPRSQVAIAQADWPAYKVHIVSENSFPTAAGLASSAAGYACLTAALGKLYGVKEAFEGELTTIARQGSGSACRSLDGGLVRWQGGVEADGADSKAVQVATEGHWPELGVLILVVSDQKKDTSSTAGMQTSVETSVLLAHRAEHVVAGRLEELEAAYLARDFDTVARITMQDSNQFHAVCLDTYPPIRYMTDVSFDIIRTVHAINAEAGSAQVAYTFDAGPNAVLLLKDRSNAAAILARFLPLLVPATTGFTGPDCLRKVVNNKDLLDDALALVPDGALLAPTGAAETKQAEPDAKRQALACAPDDTEEAARQVKYVYLTKIGPAPTFLGADGALADLATGMPL